LEIYPEKWPEKYRVARCGGMTVDGMNGVKGMSQGIKLKPSETDSFYLIAIMVFRV